VERGKKGSKVQRCVLYRDKHRDGRGERKKGRGTVTRFFFFVSLALAPEDTTRGY